MFNGSTAMHPGRVIIETDISIEDPELDETQRLQEKLEKEKDKNID